MTIASTSVISVPNSGATLSSVAILKGPLSSVDFELVLLIIPICYAYSSLISAISSFSLFLLDLGNGNLVGLLLAIASFFSVVFFFLFGAC